MQNAGTDFIKRILKDKVRLRRWKKRLLCLSCIVVFCTVYALILPALTLERKTVCGQKEHSHTETCYSEEGQITCGMAEHVHTEACYAKDDAPQENPDESLTPGTTTGDTKADGTGNTGSGDTGVNGTESTGSGDTGGSKTEGAGTGESGESKTEGAGSGDTGVNGIESAGTGDTGVSGTEDAGTGAGKAGTAGEASDMEDGTELLAEDEDDGEDAAVSLAAAASGGLDLSTNTSNLEYAKLYYQKSDGTWEELSNDTKFENENPKIRLEISYKNISIEDLKNHHSRTLVYPLPEQLRDMTTVGNITSGSTKVGTINLAEGKIVVTFEDAYLQKQLDEGNSSLKGNFYTEGKIALNKLDTNGTTTITTTDKSYKLDLGPDAVAKYGQVTVDKICKSTKVIVGADGGYYIAYTITVTAGEDGCPDVSVVDTLTNDLNRVDSYAGITTTATPLGTSANGQYPYEMIESGKSAGKIYYGNTTSDGSIPAENAASTAPGSLVWKPGTLAPNESRTLTYYVKLKDNVPLNTGAIQNNAKVFSKTYEKAEDNASFEPKINYGMPKSHEENIVRNRDGTYTITYRIDFKLDKSTSNYPLKNFSFVDCLDYYDIYTDPTIREYVCYDRGSVQLYCQKDGAIEGSLVDKSDYKIQWSKNGGTSYQEIWNETDGNPTRFKITGTAGNPITVNPGDSYYATYTVTVKPEAMAAMKADNVTIKNRYLVSAPNAQKFYADSAIINRTYDQATVGNYKWVEKAAGSAGTTTESTVPMAGDQYQYKADGSLEKETTTGKTFTVPAGSYQYTVDVNQTLGDWDVTKVAITDTLNSDKMQYTGYVKVEAYEYDSAGKISSTAKETKWVNIDSLQTFTLKPEDLGWKNNKYAYRLTYYARPVNAGSFSSAIVKNKVELKGNAVRGETPLPLDGINKETSITVSGDFKMDVKKTAWYYEDPKEEATTWKNGKLYWAIEVSGTAILKGTYFEDYISQESGLEDSFLHADSLAGIYRGKLPEGQTLADYKSLEEFKKAGLTDVTGKFTGPSFGNKKGFTGTDNFSELKVQANEQITLGEAGNLYIIICSEPPRLPAYREDYHYRNHIRTSDNGTHWIEQNQADTYLYGGADILKELGQTFTFDGTTVTSNNDGKDQGQSNRIVTTELPGPGQYASWAFKVNYGGNLTGTYRVLENIPDGMELAYIRIKWVGESQDFNQINTIEIPESELGSGWTKKQVTAATDNGSKQKTTTYYVKGNQALIKLGDFLAGKVRDNHSVDVQVVCKVTDKDVLLGGQTKDFTNKVVLQTPDGREITTATAPATITPQKIDKSFVTNNETITFTIRANQLGQELPTVEGTKLKLIDKLSTSLRLDTTSIKVVHSRTNDDLTSQCKASLKEDNTLEIEIPYDKPVTITYKAMINAPPGTPVRFTNTVYWETYTPSTGTTTGQDSYSYVAGGSVSGSPNIKLKITKNDQNNLATKLSDAEFQVVECERDMATHEITEKTGSKKWTGRTGADGTVTFGTGSNSDDPLMDYNKIYKVTETKPPAGYVSDSKEIYIMVPKIGTGEADYSEDVKACINDDRIQKQYESMFQLSVSNHRGEISVTKAFKNVGGNLSSPVSGTYKFGLYENADGTNGSGTSVTTVPLQTVTITYSAGETGSKTAKFVDLDLAKTYYVFELDDKGKPIKDSTTVAVVNGMEYFTSYTATNTASSVPSNSAVNGATVTVTNQSRVKELPSTGGYGVLIYRLAGALCIFFAGLLLLRNKLQQK